VFQFSKVPLDEARGVALLRAPLPVVGINSKELPEAKAYTLLHEVVHLMLANANEEVAAIHERRSAQQWQEVERFAEQVASMTLLPDAALRDVILTLGLQQGPWNFENIRKLARRFRITPSATATRLVAAGLMTWPQYNAWRKAWDEYVATLVLSALAANRITSVDAARYLDLKFNHFDELRTRLVQGLGNASGE
jgi:Zn-dependent peptidase ImmA (M78 family)